MVINGWDFNFDSLPLWDNRETIPWITDDFFENKSSNTACIIYSIAEASMCNYIGFLAVLKNKQNPYLFLNVTNFNFPKQDVTFNSAGNFIFLQSNIYNSASNASERPLIIIDIEANCFSYFKTKNCNPCYKIIELNSNTFGIVADQYQKKNDKRLNAFSKKKIKLKKLKWYGFEHLSNFPEKYFETE